LQVVGHHIPGQDVGGLHARCGSEVSAEVSGLGADAPQRRQVLLRVERQSLVGAAVEVDCELSHPQYRLVDGDEPGLNPVVASDRDSAREPEVAVEPGVEQRPAVRLDAEQLPACPGQVGLRLDP
jgi:hypothetical protein